MHDQRRSNRLFDQGGNIVHYISSPNPFQTVFSYLHARERGEIQSNTHESTYLNFRLAASDYLYSEVPKLFSLKLGLTGTLGTLSAEENAILDNYGFTARSFIPSTFDKKILIVEKTEVFEGKRESKNGYFHRIKEDIEKCKGGRPCLVVFQDSSQTDQLKKFLKTFSSNSPWYKVPQTLKEKTPDEKKQGIVDKATEKSRFTLITAIFGRGTDFVCEDPGIAVKGGVHIILTFYPETLTDEIQIKGRTCRQDNPGSVKQILFAPDLADEGFLNKTANHLNELVPDTTEFNNSGLSWDEYLDNKRKLKSQKKFQDMQVSLRQNAEKHQATLELLQAIEEGNKARAHQILQQMQQ